MASREKHLPSLLVIVSQINTGTRPVYRLGNPQVPPVEQLESLPPEKEYEPPVTREAKDETRLATWAPPQFGHFTRSTADMLRTSSSKSCSQSEQWNSYNGIVYPSSALATRSSRARASSAIGARSGEGRTPSMAIGSTRPTTEWFSSVS